MMKRQWKWILAAFVLTVACLCTAQTAQAAKKKTVYVLTKTYTKGVKKPNIEYKYNKTGLLKSYSRMGGMVRGQYKYDKKNRLTRYRRSLNEWTTFDYSYNKKNQITGINGYYTRIKDGKFAYDGLKTTYEYNGKGQIVKETTTGEVYDYEAEKTVDAVYTIQYTYNGKGLLTQRKETVQMTNTMTGTWKLTYDKKGNLTRYEDDNGVTTFANTYKSGRLTKRVTTYYDGTKVTETYQYKKMSVKKNLVSSVKAQQWSLLNMNLNLAIPENSYNGM